jgi:integrase
MLDIAVDMGALAANPITGRRGLKAPDKPRKPNLPEQADLEKVFTEIESIGGRGVRAGEFCRFLNLTGCRKGEAAAVRLRDVDLARGVLRVNGTKTEGSRREVPLIPAARVLVERILAHHAKSAKVGADGNPVLNPDAPLLGVGEAQKSLDRACAKVGVPRLTHHDLRDSFATACIEAGVDIPTVAGWLGHVDGGALLMRVYAHHRRAHSVAQAAKVTFGGAS